MDFENFTVNVFSLKSCFIQIVYLEESIFVYVGDGRLEINNLFLAIKTPYVIECSSELKI